MRQQSERGAVALITVAFISILVVIITVAMARLMVGEARQSTDAQDSTVAYYTAQGAAENAAWNVRTQVAGGGTPIGSIGQDCSSGGALPTQVTCIKVSTSLADVVSSIDLVPGTPNSKTYDLTNATLLDNNYMKRVVLQWDTDSADPSAFTDPWAPDPGPGTPGSAWNIGQPTQPPVMELSVVTYFPGQNTNIDSAYSANVILNPRCNVAPNTPCPAGGGPEGYTVFDFRNALAPANTPVVEVNCSGGKPMRCKADIENISPQPPAAAGYRTVITLTPLSGSAQYDLEAYADQPTAPALLPAGVTCQPGDIVLTGNDGSCKVPIALDNAQIKVTSSVGDANRDVVMEVPIRSEVSGLGNVLEGDSDICKNFELLYTGTAYQVTKPAVNACNIAR